MKARALLRIAAVTTLLFGAGHTLGYPWVGEVTDEQLRQLAAVKLITSHTQGFTRSYWDFHVGFGLTISLLFLAQAIIFWRLGSLMESEPKSARLITDVFAAFYLACIPLNFIYFFWAPIICSAIVAACLLAALLSERKPTQESSSPSPI